MTAAVVDRMLGERLSPSQVNTFLSCPAKWYFRYALGLAERRRERWRWVRRFIPCWRPTSGKRSKASECEREFGGRVDA